MAVTVSYDKDCKMIISGVACSCGCQHHAIDKDIYIGKGLLPRIPSYIAKRGLGTTACWWRTTIPTAWPGRRWKRRSPMRASRWWPA